MRHKIAFSFCLALAVAASPSLFAGGRLETIDITGRVPSPIPGHLVAKVIGIEWDPRCIPVQYSLNNTISPIPNPLPPGTSVLSLADARTTLQANLDAWNSIPTSFINMRITREVANTGLAGFDMVNEISFRTSAGFSAIAVSPSVALIADVTLVDGDRLDNDADSDVSDDISVATDVDGDGDIEFPAGFYKAGTILDNDVQFNTKTSNGFRFTIGDAALDTVTRSVDLTAVGVHEFGHSFGLSHSMNNQHNRSDGSGATMFPFIDTGDPEAERRQRDPDTDDTAWASFLYREGSSTAMGHPGRLGPGDVAFNRRYGVIKGNVTHGMLPGQPPIAGAAVHAEDVTGTDTVSTFSGTTQLSFNPNTGQLFLINPAFNILNGEYSLPVPMTTLPIGRFMVTLPFALYELTVEPVDGQPVSAGSISFTAQVGAIFGQMNFNEERYNGLREDDLENSAGDDTFVLAVAGRTTPGIDITTNRTANINSFGTRDFVGFTLQPAGSLSAVQVRGADIGASPAGPNFGVHSATFDNFVADASVAPVWAQAILTTGTVSGNTATLDLATPLARKLSFLGQDNDFAPFHFRRPRLLGQQVRARLATPGTDVFIVLQLPTTTPFPGVSNIPPLIGLDGGVANNDVPIFGRSFISTDGGATFTRVATFNFRFSLVLSEPVPVP